MDSLLLCVLTVAAVVASTINMMECCSCMQPDPFYEICNSNLTIRAKVLSVTYPNGLPEHKHEAYPVRHQLQIDEVIASSVDSEDIPDVLATYGPDELCGLVLMPGSTYILAGNIYDDSMNPEKKVLSMGLCNMYLPIGGEWGMPENEVDELMEMINCSNPAQYYTAGNQTLRRAVHETRSLHLGQHHNKETAQIKKALAKDIGDPFKAFMKKINRRELANGIESFLSAASGTIRKRMDRQLPW